MINVHDFGHVLNAEILMYSPPFIPPASHSLHGTSSLYFVKRGKLINIQDVNPTLFATQRGWLGG